MVAMVAWLGCDIGIATSSQIISLSNKLPYTLYPNSGSINSRMGRFGLISKHVFSDSYWHTCALALSLYSNSISVLFVLFVAIVSLPRMLTVVKSIKDLFRHYFKYSEKFVNSFINSYDPEVIFYCSGAAGAVYQLNQWIPVLERCGKRVLILVRDEHYLNGLASTSLPIAYVRVLDAIDLFIAPSTRIVMYPANSGKNINMFRWSNLFHVFVNHGESDKVVNVNKFLRGYDRLYLAGGMAADRIEAANLDIPQKNLVFVGRPQAEMILDINNDSDLSSKRISILYAPTWEGFSKAADYTSISRNAIEAFKELINNDNYHILFKAHPYTGTIRSDVKSLLRELVSLFRAANNVEIFQSRKNIHELMNDSDIMITDVSSVLNDYLFTEKPIILTNPSGIDEQSYHSDFFSSRAAYILNKDMTNLTDTIKNIRGKDVVRQERLKIKKYSIGSWPNGALQRFNEQLALDYESTG
jgi:hypothetical protein